MIDENYHYGAQVSSLTASPDMNYDSGTVVVKVTPGEEEGKQPEFTVSPQTDYIKIENKAKTVAADDEENLTLEREHGENTITIEGTIPAGAETVQEWMAVWEREG